MQVIILAGGKGTRLLKFTKKPKIFALFGNITLIDLYLDIFKQFNTKNINFILGNKSEQIIEHLKKILFNGKIHVEKKPLGTAGALENFNTHTSKDLLVIMGDVLTNFNAKKFLKFHKEKNADISLFVHPNNHPYDSDLIDLGKNDRVIKFYSKDRKKINISDNLATAGIYLLKTKVLKLLKKNTKQDLSKDLIIKAIKKKKKVFAYKSAEYVKDIGTPERYFQALNDIKNKKFLVNSKNKKNVAIFMDRDGVINKEKKNYQYSNPCDLYPGVIDAIKRINRSNYLAIIISNQPSIAKGFVSRNYVDYTHKKLQTELGLQNVYLNDIFYCPHHPDKGFKDEVIKYKIKCLCRKPRPGLILEAKKKYNIELSKSYLLGNSRVDYLAAKNANVKAVIINNKELTKEVLQKKIFSNLKEFTKYFFKK